MKRVTGIGGIFFKCDNPEKQKEWYQKHLGINSGDFGGTFEWRLKEDPDHVAYTAWSLFKSDTRYFSPSEKPFMLNYRVENLVELLDALKKEGVQVFDKIEEFEFGKFGWIMDPEGNKIELWEPNDENYFNESK
ncbi:VOC family protein [Solitalea canadensis]|uniref:Lactoylglutathione lyase family protein n=1 Tax=Solitalea canadensis (strain ATCC 29591 / DSM 3403 / JCM 21819 / LMG 8368 / NBRC 15130 / NCIMB 12057 / USAM 9D) TaxID=929556 RepID=H8KRQ9_SOLCM|nr:VOC family protein [Solitalea canadensis]AFD07640.1 lactoylglutathione lyase family protein [Solitalea canadensis DSM 3403]